MIKDKLISFAMLLGVAVLLIVSVIVSTVLTSTRQVTNNVVGQVPGIQIFWWVVTILASIALIFLVFLALFRFLPRADVKVKDVWLAALLTAIVWVLLKELFALYLGSSFSNYDATYGTLGTLIALLTWIYLSIQVILAGAEFASETYHIRRMRADVAVPKVPESRQSPWFTSEA